MALIILAIFSIPHGRDHLIDLLMVMFLLITIVFFLFFIVMVVLLVYWSWFLMFTIITFFFILSGHDCLVRLLIVVFSIHCSHHFLFSFFCCDCLVGFLVMVIGALWEIKWFAINLVIGFLSYNDHLQFFAFIVFTIFFVSLSWLFHWSLGHGSWSIIKNKAIYNRPCNWVFIL